MCRLCCPHDFFLFPNLREDLLYIIIDLIERPENGIIDNSINTV